MSAFYERLGPDHFRATAQTRGPWDDRFQHGGPPAALCAEALTDAGPFRLAQLSVDFLRPVPIADLRRSVEWIQRGRTRERARVTLCAGDTPVMLAHATRLRATGPTPASAPRLADPLPAACPPWRFNFFQSSVGYHTAMEMRVARGTWGAGPVALWMRMRGPLIAGEPVAPALRAIVAADAAHGIAPAIPVDDHSLINPTLTVALSAPPQGEWVLLDAMSAVSADGIGHMAGRLWDCEGLVGQVMAPLLVAPRG